MRDNQCSFSLVKHFKGPLHLVWSLVRRFDQPQKYKPFISRCVVQGDLEIGSLREVNVKSGLPATTNTERLELLHDDDYVALFLITSVNMFVIRKPCQVGDSILDQLELS
ncbi:hypothetical protein MKX03_015860 [Papaver bracteatum]|nr:hypothetical protein MKX03_015860 [Papaver bracteatum]